METNVIQQTQSLFGGELAISIRYSGPAPKVTCNENAGDGHRMGVISISGAGSQLYAMGLSLRLPMRDIHRTFTGAPEMWKGLELASVALKNSWDFASNRFSPVICNFNKQGRNRFCFGLIVSRAEANLQQSMPNTGSPLPMRDVRITVDRRWPDGVPLDKPHDERLFFCGEDIPWHEAVRRYVLAHESAWGRRTWPVPDAAFDPLWCSWYAQLEEMTADSIRREIPFIRDAGFGTVTIDAPWFASEQHLSHAGHYTPCENFKDLAKVVEEVHSAGLRFVLWCAPAMVGVLSPVRKKLEPLLILGENGSRTNALCPNEPEAVRHMTSTVERLMRDYNLDGLKLDFLDAVAAPCMDKNHKHAYPTLGEAMFRAMDGLRNAICSVKPSALIEYRHRYANVTTRDFATWYRGNDSPYDVDYIRRQNAVLRTFVPEGAVLSDYAVWHPGESLSNIGRMMAAMIFTSVPAVSVNLSAQPPEVRDLIKRWNAFHKRHLDGLARGDFRVLSPEATCNVTVSRSKKAAFVGIFGSYAPDEIEVGDPAPEEVYIYNDTNTARIPRIRDAGKARVITVGPELETD